MFSWELNAFKTMEDIEKKQQEDLNQNDHQSGDPQSDEEKGLKQGDGQPADPQEGEGDDDDYYKKELEKVKQERDNYKEGLLSKKEELKKTKEENPELSEEKIQEMVDSRLKEEFSSFKEDIFKNQINNAIDSLTEDENKKELIRYHYQNSINKSGDINADIRRALLLADEKKIFKEKEELKRSLSSQNSISNTSYGSTAKREEPDMTQVPNFTDGEQRLVNRMNRRRQSQGKEPLSNKELWDIKRG